MWDDILTAGEEALVSQGWSPEARARWHWQVLISHGEWETGVELIEAWLETHPNDGEAMVWLAEALLGMSRPEEAISWLERATTSSVHSYVVRGETALALGHYEEAEKYFRIALFLKPNSRAHLGLARRYRASGNLEQASEEYARAVQPAIVLHTYELVLYHRAGWSPLLPQVTRIRHRQHSEAALEWGALLEQQGQSELAHRVYEMALSVDPYCNQIRQRMD
jgi:tetratricopeptide (TPR) repeat protein